MSERRVFDKREDCLAAIQELLEKGVPKHAIEVVMPAPDHAIEKLLKPKPSPLKFFTLIGSLIGLTLGLGFPIYTVLDWPKITGGKPLISLTPFIIIGFELTILLGSILSFLGFLFLAKKPSIRTIAEPVEHENHYILQEKKP